MWLVLLAVWMVLSGLDDLFIGLHFLLARRPRVRRPSKEDLAACSQRSIAILVPLWHEDRVIGRMLDHNLSAIRYSNYHIFAGVYPNDPATRRAVPQDPRIHVVVCHNDGPTSKGDCLNQIYLGIQEYEAHHGSRFEIIVTHDAEDLIHPESLPLINWFSTGYDMVQIPVLPLPTGFRDWTHGVYCDEFAEYQSKDVPVRQKLGGFLPGNGVGTGITRRALDRLVERHGRIFEPDCLTEDYENGYRLAELGCRQLFVPVFLPAAGMVATREYFPRSFSSAVRQRARWVTGITLQGWERHGWRGDPYWFWRDRKGLLGNLLSPVANLVLLLGIAAPGVRWLCSVNLAFSIVQAGLRSMCSARIYGRRFALGVVPRMFWGNLINFAATVTALRQFAAARLRRAALAWHKTEHVYPRPRIGELLVRMRCVSLDDLEEALTHCPAQQRIGEYLLYKQSVAEVDLYQALSIQSGIPLGLESEISSSATRALPVEVARRWNVMPYRLKHGKLHVLTAEIPSPAMTRDLASVSSLEIHYRLVGPRELQRISEGCRVRLTGV
jgi:bacteriophage N4 adsorption protein B